MGFLRKKVKIRKEIVRKEIYRTGINAQKLDIHNSEYLRALLLKVREFDDEITLIRWFIPIKLTFERVVHIFVKHVEETKFADGKFAIRTFFDYEFDQIWTLLKVIVRQEEKAIKEHFLYVSVADETNQPHLKKKYRNENILFNGDSFALEIDVNGYIIRFHQKNSNNILISGNKI